MKKNLRLLCLGLATLTFTAGFAQAENVTSKLRNADMEEGVRGWGIDGEGNIFGKNTKSQAARRGFHGVTDGVLENWKSDATTGLSDNSVSQTVRDLPAGTYVFGAYIAASIQGTQESNKDAVTGVTLFANEAGVPVATDNPDNSAAKWAHTAKFNVATTVAEGGSLQVGLKIENTTANYVVWDNATLYYFGNMSEADALNEMAKIDMAATVAIADTCFAYKMNADTLALLTDAKTAAQAIATADQLWQLDEDLYWAINKSTKSISDYRSFNNVIAHAEDMANTEWSAQQTPGVVDALNALIVSAKATYEAATAGRPELNEQKAALNEAAALVALDSCYVRMETLQAVVEELEPGEEVGEYSEEMIDRMDYLLWEVNAALDAADGLEISALAAQKTCDSLFTAWQFAYDNPITIDSFPFTVGEADGTVATKTDGRFEFTSKTYNMAYPITNLRFTFLESYNENGAACLDSNKYPQIAIAEFYLYDGEGNQIELTEENFSTNAQETREGPMANICDGEKGNFWHSAWSFSIGTYHYLEIAIPDGLDLTSFSFGWTSRYTAQVVPKTVEVSSVSEASFMLESAVQTAKQMNAFAGTDPGFYNADLTAFWNAIAAAEAVLENGGTDEEMYAAIGELETQQGLVDEMKINLPVVDKKYRFVIGYDGFYAKQGVQKAMYARGDSVVWWQTAGVDSIGQEFVLESLGQLEDETPIYKVLNVHTNRYMVFGDNNVTLTADKAEADTVKLVALGAGAFNLAPMSGDPMHAGDHNSGAPSSSAGAYGGIYGIESGLCLYPGAFNSASAWFIREMQALPYTAAVAGADYRSETFHLYSGVNTLNLTADKACAFTDLTVYDLWGNVIPADVNVSGNSATLLLDTLSIESFSLTFKNNEGVASLVVNGNISKLSELQIAYDAAVAVEPTEGLAVMEYADLSAYNAAIATAEALLVSGGTDEQITAAIAAMEKAVAELVPNMPEPDKTYFIVSALEAFEENHGVPMMLYASSTGQPRWMYENTDNQNRLWQFELAPVAEDADEDTPAMYFIKNVATGTYFGENTDALVATGSAYAITALGGKAVALDKNGESSGRIHANGHGGGAGKGSNIVYWSSGLGTASAWYIYESNHYITDIDFTEIEEGADEQVAPAKKGIFDLFGRRIEAPAATGIYIVDGKKRVIKK